MAVILDIPMPGGCGSCPLNDDNWGCIITGKPVQDDSRPETCPLMDIDPIEEKIKELRQQNFKYTGIISQE